MRTAETIDDLSGVVAPMFDALGLPHFAISRFFGADRRPDVSVLAGRFHSGWSQRYTSANYVRHSVIAHELLRTRQPYSWEQVMRTRDVDEAQKRIKNEAREIGLGDGLFTPVRWLDGSHAAVVLGGPCPELLDPLIRTSAEVLSAYYARESRRLIEHGVTRSLTPRQRECLAWVRQGKSSSTIAEILGLSVETVNEHLGEACRRLRVRTRVQAAVEAALAGLID